MNLLIDQDSLNKKYQMVIQVNQIKLAAYNLIDVCCDNIRQTESHYHNDCDHLVFYLAS